MFKPKADLIKTGKSGVIFIRLPQVLLDRFIQMANDNGLSNQKLAAQMIEYCINEQGEK